MPTSPDDDAARTDPLIGQLVGERFQVTELVARGSMGRVYRAEQLPLGRTVALKLLAVQDHWCEGDGYSERFLREASALARLHHPNTVRIFDFGLWEDRSFLVMEFVEGTTLGRVLKRGPMPPARALHVCAQIAASLEEAHGAGIVHRDLKPGNILLTERGGERDVVKVVDFGLVKDIGANDEITQVGQILGSPHYMSPEQIRDEDVDHRADVYALGVILFRCLAGRTPFRAAETPALLMAHLTRPVPALADFHPEHQAPPCLEWTARTCLAKKREDRFGSVRELRRALRACAIALSDPALHDLTLRLDPNGSVLLPPGVTEGSLSRNSLAIGIALPPPAPAPPAVAPEPETSAVTHPSLDPVIGTEDDGRPVAMIAAGFVAMALILAGLGYAFWPRDPGTPTSPPLPDAQDAGTAVLAPAPAPTPPPVAAPAPTPAPEVVAPPAAAPAPAPAPAAAAPAPAPAAVPAAAAPPAPAPAAPAPADPPGTDAEPEPGPEPKPEPDADPEPTPAPAPASIDAGSDLKDPWAD